MVYQSQTEPTVPDVPDSHDERLQRVREAIWQESHNMPREVRRARDMVMRLVERVGHVDLSAGVIPGEIRRQQWSFLNILLMWAAATGDRSNVVLHWLAASAQNTSVPVCGASLPGNEAVMTGWDSLHGAMQVLGIRSRKGLAEWVHAQGFPQPRWRAHFSGRAQERLLNAAAAHDARATVLESAYVQVILHACDHGITEDAHPIPHRRPIETPRVSEEYLDTTVVD